MSDTRKANQSESLPVDAERQVIQARMALKTGISAYENENYVFAETLFIKALDLFEQANKLEEKEYFQCLHQIADTYFQLGRYFEAKSYYERLSVARLKNPDSTDAQVVVALLKLASTYEKLGEIAESLTAFDLIMELAEKTIPNGHALFGVIFDSYEDLINRQIIDPTELAKRTEIIVQNREQFGFSKSSSDARWAHAITEPAAEEGESDNVLSQAPEQLRKNLKAWTHASRIKPQVALEEAVQRVNQERLSSLQSREEVSERPPREEGADRLIHAHLHPDMFRRKPHLEKDSDDVEIVEKELGSTETFQSPSDDYEAGEASIGENAPTAGPEVALKKTKTNRGALKDAKRLNTDRKRFNPLPALTVIACLGAVGGAVFVAHEYVENSGAGSETLKTQGELDYSGNSWVSSDSRKMLRCLSPVACEYTACGASVSGVYQIKGQPSEAKSIFSDFFKGNPTRLIFDEVPGGLKAADGTILYSETSKDRQILTKAQAIANFATYYFASHGHFYPSKAEDFQFGNARFAWENPITGQVNKPIVKNETHTKADFDSSFITALKNMRDSKPIFDADTMAGSPAGLIECLALIPSNAGSGSAPVAVPVPGPATANGAGVVSSNGAATGATSVATGAAAGSGAAASTTQIPATTTPSAPSTLATASVPATLATASTTPAPTRALADDAGCAFIIRAYDNNGKLICSSDPQKAFVIVLKNGISIDPIKAVHDESSAAATISGKVEVLINPLPAPAPASASGADKKSVPK